MFLEALVRSSSLPMNLKIQREERKFSATGKSRNSSPCKDTMRWKFIWIWHIFQVIHYEWEKKLMPMSFFFTQWKQRNISFSVNATTDEKEHEICSQVSHSYNFMLKYIGFFLIQNSFTQSFSIDDDHAHEPSSLPFLTRDRKRTRTTIWTKLPRNI